MKTVATLREICDHMGVEPKRVRDLRGRPSSAPFPHYAGHTAGGLALYQTWDVVRWWDSNYDPLATLDVDATPIITLMRSWLAREQKTNGDIRIPKYEAQGNTDTRGPQDWTITQIYESHKRRVKSQALAYLAERSGIHYDTVRNIFNGKRPLIKFDSADRLICAMDVLDIARVEYPEIYGGVV